MISRVSLLAIAAASVAAPLSAQVANPAAWPVAKSPAAITDAATEARIDALIKRMTVEQKVGQTIQGDISAMTPADLAKYPLGSILAGGNSGPYGNERATPQDWHRLVKEYRDASTKTGANIPVIFGIDAVHGHSNVPGATIFPHNIGLGAARDPDMIRRIGAATALEVAATGIEWTFAPTLAVPQDGRWGRAYEGYSSDPALVASYAGPMTLGVQGALSSDIIQPSHIAATAKHFLADGGTENGKDQGDARIGEADLVRIHNAGYPPSIDAGALTVMVSFSSWQGIKHHGNKSLLTDVLKGRMGFAGFTVGDWNAHGQIPGCSTTDCPQALNAGLDMYMAPDSWKGLFESLTAQVKAGKVPMARLDDAVRRILRAKAKLGLLDSARPDPAGGFGVIGSPPHLALAREAVAKSLVLLKNNGSVLPIKPGAKVLVAGTGADNFAKQAGGWTISWQGTDVTAADMPNGQTIYAGIADAVKAAGGTAILAKDGAFTAKPDVAIVVYGEDPYAEFQGDVPTLDYQPAGATDLALLKRLKAAGIPVVSVFLSGRPLWTSPEINASDAFVAAWLPGSQGAGVADVLVAKKDGKTARPFTGTLSFLWPKTAAAPVTDPLWPLGHGLKYGEAKPVAALSEDPGIDIAAALNADRYFDAGRTLAPWAMTVNDAGGGRPVTSAPVDSPAGAITTRSVDLAAQEDAKQIVWTGKGQGTVSIAGPAADLNRQLTGAFALAIDWRVDTPPARPVTLAFGDRPLVITDRLKLGAVTTTRIPLRCFTEAGADITRIGTPLAITTNGTLGVTLARVRLEPISSADACPAAAPRP
jgi:beta-glucosidase